MCYTRKTGPGRQRKSRKKQQQEGSGYIDSQNIIRGINLGKKAADNEVGRTIVDDVVSLIPRSYKALKNKLFRRKKQFNDACSVLLTNSSNNVY